MSHGTKRLPRSRLIPPVDKKLEFCPHVKFCRRFMDILSSFLGSNRRTVERGNESFCSTKLNSDRYKYIRLHDWHQTWGCTIALQWQFHCHSNRGSLVQSVRCAYTQQESWTSNIHAAKSLIVVITFERKYIALVIILLYKCPFSSRGCCQRSRASKAVPVPK